MKTLLLAGAFTALLAFAPLPGRADPSPPAHRPNIVVFIADDLGWEESSPYGNPVVRTPNLQRLANEGLRFDRFYLTASSCSPSRSSLFSGLYPHNTGAPDLHTDMSPAVELFIEPLRTAGYHTMLIGKSHGTNNPEVRKKFSQLVLADWSRPWTMGDMWEKALRERPKDRPFFLWAASIDPHRPYKQGTYEHPHDPAKVIVPPYYPDIPEMREELAGYYDEISRFDEHVGRVLRMLEQENILDDTVIVVLSDNGRAFPQAKTRLNVAGVRSPFIVRYPPLIKAGGVTTSLASAVDLAPTLVALAGAPAMQRGDGTSLVPVLRDPRQTVRRLAFTEHNWHGTRAYERGAVTATHLYIRNWLPALTNPPPGEVVPMPAYQAMQALFDAGRLPPTQADCFLTPRPEEELYAVATDPHCLHNLAADPANQTLLRELRASVEQWQANTRDAFPGADKLRPDDFDRRTGTVFKKAGGKKSAPAPREP